MMTPAAHALDFPSEAWARELSKRLAADPEIQAALAEFGPFTAGTIVEKGAGLSRDFCVHIEAAPGRETKLLFCEDEDELDDLDPNYLLRAPHGLARDLLRAALAGETPDPMKLLTSGQIKLRGDLSRVVRVGGRHPFAGLATLRGLPTRTLG